MPLTEQRCFDIAIRIVKQHSKENLVSTYHAILEDKFSSCQIKWHEVIADELISTDDQHIPLLEQCIQTRTAFFSAEKEIFISPIVSLGKTTSLIALHGKITPEEMLILEKLMALFSNQLLLLDNNNHDTLTGLLNRHSFEERIANLIETHPRRHNDNKPNYCFAILDIDFFKRVNDDFGHLYGDEVLILFTNIMEATFRHDDMLFRYGGEEFAVLLRDVDLPIAIHVLNRFRENVEKYDFPQVGSITVSIGATELHQASSRIEIISRADQALYYSKQNGRNQVNNFEALISEGKLVDKPADVNDIELF